MIDKTGEVVPFSNISDLGTLSVFQKSINDFESYKTVVEESVLPIHYNELNNYVTDSQFLPAIGLMVAGFLTIFILERVGTKKQ